MFLTFHESSSLPQPPSVPHVYVMKGKKKAVLQLTARVPTCACGGTCIHLFYKKCLFLSHWQPKYRVTCKKNCCGFEKQFTLILSHLTFSVVVFFLLISTIRDKHKWLPVNFNYWPSIIASRARLLQTVQKNPQQLTDATFYVQFLTTLRLTSLNLTSFSKTVFQLKSQYVTSDF